jgi:hypothetical protein
MDTIIALLFLISIILFIVGLISPKSGLFWLTTEKTRKKVLLFYGLSTLTLFVIIAIIAEPSEKKAKDISSTKTENEIEKTPTVKEKTFQITNKSVKEWFGLNEKKKEKFIKNNIIGKWQQILQVGLFEENNEKTAIVNKNFKPAYQQKGDFVAIEEFVPQKGFFDFPHFNSTTHNDRGQNEYNTSFLVTKDDIMIAAGTSDQSTEKVIYLSKNLCVRKSVEPLTGTESIQYYAKISDNGISNYQEELSQLISNDIVTAYTLLQNGYIEIINSNNISGYQNIYNGYKQLSLLSKIDENIKLESDEVIIYISEALKEQYPSFVKNFSEKFTTEINELRKSEADFVFFAKFDEKFNSIRALIEIGKAFKQDVSYVKKEIAKHENEYKKLYKEYSLYGDLTQTTLMKLTAEYYIEENANDPKSIKFVEGKLIGKTPKGLAYQITYRGKNAFGATVLETKKLLLKWDIQAKDYYVAGHL